MTPGLPLLLLALALRRAQGNPGASPGPPPASPELSCGAEVLEAVLGRLRALEGEVRALQGQCGDSLGPQAGTGSTAAWKLCDTPGAGGCCGCRPGEAGNGLPCPAPRCPLDCSDQGRCRAGRCHCFEGFTGPFCATPVCPPGRGGPHCTLEIPSVTLRLAARNQTSFRVTWPRPAKPVDGYEVAVIPMDEPTALTTHELPGSAVTFEVTGLTPGQAFEIFIQAQRDQHLGAPGTLRVRTLLAPSQPTHGGSRKTPTFLAPPVAPASPSARGSPASPRSPVSPASPGSPGSLGSPASSTSPKSPASLRSPVSPESSAAPTSLESPWSPESPVSPRSPTSPWPPASPQSPLSPASPVSPVLPNVPSLHELGVKLSSYNGSLLQRLESHLRATNYPLRGNQTVPAVARAILSYLLRRSPASLRYQFLRHLQQSPHPKPQVLPGSAGEALVDLDGLRGHAETVVIRYRLLEEPEGEEGEMRVPGDTTVARVPGLVPGATYRVEVHGVVRGRVSKSYTSVVTAGLGDTSEPPPEWKNLYEVEVTEPQGAMAKAAPSEEEPPQRPRLGTLTVSHVTPSSIQLEWSVLEGTFDSFTVQYRDAQGQPQALAVDGGSRTVTVPGLAPSRRYKFNLYGVWGRKRIGLISTDAVTTASAKPNEEPPSPPRLGELTASHVSPDSVQLQWSVPEGSFDSFMVQYKDAQGQPQVLPVDGGSRTVTVPGLVPSRRYKFNLYGLWGRKRLGPISTDAVTEELEKEEPPSQPRLGELTASHVSPSSVQLEWSIPEGTFDYFTVQYKDAQGQTQELHLDSGSRTVTVSGLLPSHPYKFNLYGMWGQTHLGPISTDIITAAAPAQEKPPSPPRLGELTASHVSPDSVQLQWSIPEGSFDSFTVQYKDAQGQPQVLPVDGGSRTVTVPGLSPSRRYKFNLYGVWGRKRLGPISTDAITAAAPAQEEPPSQPRLGELTASHVSPDSVQLEWSVPEGSFDSFTVQYKDAQGQPQVLPVDGGSRTVTVPGLVPSRRYKFNLYGVWGRKRLGPISTDAVTAVSPAKDIQPTQPRLGELTASHVSPDSVQLQWSVPEGSFDSFTVQYRDAQGQPQMLPVDGGSRTVTVPGLAPSRRYKFNLYGMWGRKRLGPISTDAITAAEEMEEEEPASQPRLGELTASDVSPNSVQLEWSVPEGSFDSFTVQYKDAQGQTQELHLDSGSRTVTVSGLLPSHPYQFNLYGVWGQTRLGPISTDTITAAAPAQEEPPSPPRLGELTASHVSPDSIQLQWSVPEGSFDSFTVQYKDAQGQPQVLPVDGGSRTATVPGLAPSRRYKFNLYGVWGRKRLGPISTDAVTAAASAQEEPPSQPRLGELTASHVSHNSVQLQWSVPEGSFDSFMVQYKDAQGQPQVLPVDGGSRTVTVPGLVPSRRYKFNLYGVWGRKRLGPISTDAVTAAEEIGEEEPPSQPHLGELTASHVSPDSVQLQWSVPEGSFNSFTVQYKDAQGQTQVLPVDGGSRTVTVPGLAPSRRYKFNLYGLWGRKRLGPISTDAVTAAEETEEEEAPSQPHLGVLTASHISPNTVQLQWSVPEGSFDSFTVQYKDAQGQPQVLPVDGGSRTVTVPGLSPSRRYKFNLYGMWGRKRLGPISTDAVTAAEVVEEEEPPSQPHLGELTASHVSPSSVQLEWSIPEGSFDSFTVQYKDAQGQPQELHLDSGSRTATVSGLLPSHPYKFNLYGVWGQTRLGPISTDTITAAAPAQEEPPSPPRLGELTASHVSPDSVQLQWSVPEGSFDSFTVQYKDAQGQPQMLPVDGGSRTVTVPGLVPSHRYKFNLYGVWGRKRLGPISTDAITAAEDMEEEEPPSPPRLGELTASHVSPDSVQLQWSVPEGSFDSFMVQYRDAQGQPQVLPVDGGSRTVTVPGLAPSHRYKFNLYGVWGRKRLGPISTDAVTAAEDMEEEEPPSPPRLGELTASHVSPDSVQLQWSVPEGSFDSFMVQYRDAQGQPQVLPVDGGSRTVTVPGLAPSHRYKFNLYGVWGRKRLGPISTDAVTATEEMEEEESPSQPRLGELTASHVSPDSVQLEWSVPEGSFDSFTVQYKDAQGQPQVLPVDGGSRTVTVPGLVPSRRYKFNLYGVWGRKRLGPISTDAVTAASPAKDVQPPQPHLGELTASHVSPDSVQLQWSVPEGSFDSFTVQYKDAQGQPQVLPVDGGSRTVTVPGLVPSRRYKFNLYGVWGRKRLGPISTDAITASEEVEEEEPPSQPRLGELTASHVSPNSVQLQWSIPEGSFDSFTVQYMDEHGQPQELHLDSGSRTATVSGLLPSHPYKFNLYGVWGQTRLGPISTDTITAAAPAKEEPPSPPHLGELTASHVSPDSIQLEWSIPEGSFNSFTVQYKDAQGQPQVLPVDGGSRTVTVPGLVPSRRYKFNLYGLWGRKRLGPISTDAVTAAEEMEEEEPPSQPSLGELTASHISPNSVQLQWSVPEGSFDSFTVQYKDAQGQPQVLPVDGGSRTVTVPGLVPSRRYKFNLYGVWGRKRLGPISTDTVTAAEEMEEEEPPSQPHLGELTASNVSPNSVQLQWSVPEGSFDSFTVQYRDAQGHPQVLPVDGGLRTVTVPGLVPSRRYKFNLYGLWGRKRLGPISTDAVTAAEEMEEEEPPSQPRLGELTASHVSPNSVQLDWSVPEGSFDSFTVQYEDAQGQTQELHLDSGSRTATVSGLLPSHPYQFNLYGMWGQTRLGPISTDTITAAAPAQEEPPSPPRLGELTASHVSPDTVQLQWSIPEGSFDSFTVQYKDAQGQPQVLPVDGGSRTVTVPGLVPSRRYKFNLYGLWGRKRLGPISTDAITARKDEDSPSKPRLGELTASHISPNSIQLQWSVPEGSFDSFTVQYKDAQGQPQVLPVDGGSRTVTVHGLVPSRRYKFNLYGVWGRKRLGPISTDAVTAIEEMEEEEPPSQPRLGELTASHVSPNSVQLEWSVPEGSFDSFTLQYMDEHGQPQELHLDSGSRTATVSGLLPSHPYQFNLYGMWGQTRLGPISTDTITAAAPAQEEPPSPPRLGELTASHVSPDSVQLQWSVPEGSFDSFAVQYKDAQGQPQVLPVDGGSRTVTVPGLVPSRRYKFNLYGVSGRKRLGPISTDAITAAAEETEEEEPPSQPRLGELTASHVSPNSVQLEWSIPEGTFDSFTVQYMDVQGQTQELHFDSGSRTATVSGLLPSHPYKFNLYGVWGQTRLGPISTDTITAAAPAKEEPPSPPRLGELTASHVSPDSVQLQWSVPEGSFDSFTVQYKDAQGQPQVLPVDGGSRTVTVPGLAPSRRYKFNLYGIWGRKRLGPISTDAITGAPGTLWVGTLWPRSAQLHWAPLHIPPDGYELIYGPPSGPVKTLKLPPEATSKELWGLEPTGHYKVQLRGRGLEPLETTFDTPPLPHPHPRDCAEEQLNGPGPSREVLIFLGGDRRRPLRVFCDMESDGGGWLVFQRRMDGSTDFWRGWEEYVRGFGNVSGEFWLGNVALHTLTAFGPTELRVDLRTPSENAFARYRDFAVGGPEDNFRLHLGAYSGTAGDALSYHAGSPFSTKDHDPRGRPRPCAVAYTGAWWYRNCHYANLNGRYGVPTDHQGINWYPWKGFEYSIPFTEMKLRPQRD